MDLKKCKIGHFYDGDKYPECPHCKNNVAERTSKTFEKKKTMEEKRTTSVTQALGDIDEKRQEREEKQVDSRRPIDEDCGNGHEQAEVKQVKKPVRRNDLGPVVGWLVGITGEEYGHSYELYATSNTIGTAEDNVVGIEDAALCNSCHCVICFDSNSLNFFVDYENSGGKIKINNYRVNENVYINYMDVLEIGGSTYVLIPLCKDGFSWWGDTAKKSSEEYVQTSTASTNYTSDYYANDYYTSTQTQLSFKQANEEVVYQPDKNYVDDNDDSAQQELTGILISSPWRCPDCNALNSMMFSKCRTCGKSK